jgi:thioesterase domain-containing protein
VAQRLVALGEPVEFVGLLDCRHEAMQPIQQTQEKLAKRVLMREVMHLMQPYENREQQDIQEAVQQLREKIESTRGPNCWHGARAAPH